jgi:hypothetical protein
MWEALGNWLTKRFSSPIPILFFILGAVLIIIEAVEVQLPNGTFVRHDSQIGVLVLVLGVALVIVAALFQVFDQSGPSARKLRELGDLEAKKYATLRELLNAYVVLPGGLDFAAVVYNGTLYHDISAEQFAKRLLHFRVQHNLEKQTQQYFALGNEIHELVDEMNNRLADLQQGTLFRVVFDLEKGGVFYHHISDNCYVVGATINQAAMDDNSCDLEMRSLVRSVENHIITLENQ